MTPHEGSSSVVPRPGDDAGARGPCAPIAATAAEELEGLYRFAVARLGVGSHTAEDVVQQALVIALAHGSPPDEADRQRAWLRGIVRNVIRRQARSRRRGHAAVMRLTAERGDPTEGDAGGGAGDESRTRRVRALFLAVTELDLADQELFYAVYREGRSQAWVATSQGTTVKGVEARLYRMRSRLRRAMAACDEDLS